MPKFLFKASYKPEGVQGVLAQGGTARREAIEQMFDGLGGKVEGFYFAFGETDVYTFGELPDTESATAISLAVNADGKTAVSIVPLITPEEVDAAVQKSVDFRPAGA